MVEQMTNFSYLEDYLRFRPSSNPAKFDETLNLMENYSKKGDKWWIKYFDDPAKLAARQILEPVLLIPVHILVRGLTLVLGRRPKEEELVPNNDKLIAEFSAKYPHYSRTCG